MEPITPVFPGVELPVTTYAKDQEQYKALPVYKTDDGIVVSRWQLTFKERLKILFSGNLWLTVLTFNSPLQPVKLTVVCPLKVEDIS